VSVSKDDFERINGSCHCGNLRFAFDWPEPGSEIPIRACGCELCSKHSAVWTSHPKGRFLLHGSDTEKTNLYRFGTKTADFHVCRNCGVMPISTCLITSTVFAVLNTRTFDGIDPSRFVERKTNFDGETASDRLARRQKTWTPEIAVSAPSP
jgi:hypothetical protein